MRKRHQSIELTQKAKDHLRGLWRCSNHKWAVLHPVRFPYCPRGEWRGTAMRNREVIGLGLTGAQL